MCHFRRYKSVFIKVTANFGDAHAKKRDEQNDSTLRKNTINKKTNHDNGVRKTYQNTGYARFEWMLLTSNATTIKSRQDASTDNKPKRILAPE